MKGIYSAIWPEMIPPVMKVNFGIGHSCLFKLALEIPTDLEAHPLQLVQPHVLHPSWKLRQFLAGG